MRYLLTFCIGGLMVAQVMGQQPDQAVCTNPKSQIDLYGNNIRARLLNAGDMFWDLSRAQFIPNNPQPNSNGPATLFAAALWIGGIDQAGDLHVAANTYRNGGKTDYWAGPLSTTGLTDGAICANWDRHFKVKGSQIAAFLQNLPAWNADPTAAISQYPAIMGWPGRGNPFFAQVNGFDLPTGSGFLAPFYDADNNGQYNALNGDYPAVLLRGFPPFVPAEMVWWVFNDQGGGAVHTATQGKALGLEVQVTAWAFNCIDKPTANNTIFTSHKMIYRGAEALDSCFVGMWTDFDLGCPNDDYIGCHPQRNTMFAYNTDPIDGQPGTVCDGGIKTFGDTTPVQSATFLSTRMDKFIYAANSAPSGAGDPTWHIEYYNNLTGNWRDGKPLTYGQSGYQSGAAPTDYAFPDDPANPNGWSMCTASLAGTDIRGLGSHKIGRLNPGQIEELNVAWTYHPRTTSGPCDLGPAYAQIDSVIKWYNQGFSSVCTGLSADHAPDWAAVVSLSPNPASQTVTLRYTDLDVLTISCFDMLGCLMWRQIQPPAGEVVLPVSALPVGMYQIQVDTRQGRVVRRLQVQR